MNYDRAHTTFDHVYLDNILCMSSFLPACCMLPDLCPSMTGPKWIHLGSGEKRPRHRRRLEGRSRTLQSLPLASNRMCDAEWKGTHMTFAKFSDFLNPLIPLVRITNIEFKQPAFFHLILRTPLPPSSAEDVLFVCSQCVLRAFLDRSLSPVAVVNAPSRAYMRHRPRRNDSTREGAKGALHREVM